MEQLLRQGRCLSLAYKELKTQFKKEANNETAFIVHGWLYSSKLKRNIKHAWIEFIGGENNDYIYEPINDCFILKELLTEKNYIKEVNRYTLLEISLLTLKTKLQGGNFQF